MAIDFTLAAQQCDLRRTCRKFAKEVLDSAKAAELLATPEERFLATKPTYQAMIAAGFLRKCIPLSAGGKNAGLTDTAIMVEELHAVNASVTLTPIGTVLGLLPLLVGGTEEQRSRLLPPFLKLAGAPSGLLSSRTPGTSVQDFCGGVPSGGMDRGSGGMTSEADSRSGGIVALLAEAVA